MDRGDLVPDELICRVIVERVDSDEAARRLPARRLPAHGRRRPTRWTSALEDLGRRLTAALLIEAPDEEVIRRLSGRRICKKNGHVYHLEFDPPKNEGFCDQDGSPLVQRDDDKEETVKHRLEVFHDQTKPLIDLLRGAGPAAPLRRHARARRGQRPHPRHACHAASGRGALDRWRSSRRSPEEIEAIAAVRAGSSPAATGCCARKARPGVTTGELDEAAERFIRSQGAEPVFKGYRGFPGSICASPNSMVVHGIPGPTRSARGDVLSIDIGVVLDGWVADAAVTLPIGPVSPVARGLLATTRAALFDGRRAVPARATASATSRRGPAPGRGRRLLGDPLAGGPRRRPRHARGPADPQLRRARHRPRAGGGHGPGHRADGQRRRPRGPDGRRRLGRLLPGRLAGGPLRAHRGDHRRGSADPHPLARGGGAARRPPTAAAPPRAPAGRPSSPVRCPVRAC